MNKTDAKHRAQDELLSAMGVAFMRIHEDSTDMSDEERQLVLEKMDQQMLRVEKLFGYVPGSWTRGC